jgi:release factor glutamine methyltransferase
MTIKELTDWGAYELVAFDSARLDAELLLSHVLQKEVTYILTRDDEAVHLRHERRFRRLVARRKKGIPVAYLRGHKEFYGLDFAVNKHVLVPRPDTELLVEAASGYITSQNLLLDVGTGSGCIPVSILKEVPNLQAVAADISGSALKVARENAHRHHVDSRMVFIKSDLLKSVDLALLDGWEVVVTANLPYVPKDYQVNIETQFEPQIALYGGQDGLDIYRRLVFELEAIKPKAMFFECFEFQAAMLAEHLPDYKLKFVRKALGTASVMMLERVSR